MPSEEIYDLGVSVPRSELDEQLMLLGLSLALVLALYYVKLPKVG